MKYICIAFSVLLISSCAAGIKSLSKKSLKVSPGQNKDQVIQVMDTPQNRQTYGKREAWQYCATNMNAYTSLYVIIWFQNDRVTQTSTYSAETTGGCQNHFRTIQWN